MVLLNDPPAPALPHQLGAALRASNQGDVEEDWGEMNKTAIIQAPDSAKKHQSFEENMKRLHAEMERMLYAAEIACMHTRESQMIPGHCRCPFIPDTDLHVCPLPKLRSLIGKHPEQHDPTEEGK